MGLFANFKFASKEFALLRRNFKHPKTARMVQSIDFLTVKHEFDGIGGLELNIFVRGKYKKAKTLCELVDLHNRNTVYRCLDEIRINYEFKVGEHLDPTTLDFQGHLYATVYDRSAHVLQWYRNQQLFNEMVAKINDKAAKSAAKRKPEVKPADTVGDIVADTVGVTVVDTVVNIIETETETEFEIEKKNPKHETSEPLFTSSTSPSGISKGEQEKKPLTPSPTPSPSSETDPVEDGITNFHDDAFTIFAKIMLATYGVTVDFDPKVKAKLEQLRSNFNRRVQAGEFLDFYGKPRSPEFRFFLADAFDNWELVEEYCGDAWEWGYGNFKDPKVFCSEGGKHLLDWFYFWYAEERQKDIAEQAALDEAALDAAIEDARLYGYTAPTDECS